MDKDVIWSELDHSDNGDMELHVIEWNGKNVAWLLYDAFQKCADNSIFAITAVCMSADKEYVYNGRSLAEYEAAMLKEQRLITKLEGLRKDGDYLKYRENLYLSGTPDGEKWTKELYEETVSWYGEDVLNKYIQNGEFLSGKLEQDLQMLFKEEAQLEYEIAMSAYISSANLKLKEKLAMQHIVAEYSSDVDYLLIYATEEELAEIEFENQLDWLFELATKRSDSSHDLDDVAE